MPKFAVEAFFAELSRRAEGLTGDDRVNLQRRIETARELMGGKDAIERFLNWSVPNPTEPEELGDD